MTSNSVAQQHDHTRVRGTDPDDPHAAIRHLERQRMDRFRSKWVRFIVSEFSENFQSDPSFLYKKINHYYWIWLGSFEFSENFPKVTYLSKDKSPLIWTSIRPLFERFSGSNTRERRKSGRKKRNFDHFFEF
jgi:hypothetical protein